MQLHVYTSTQNLSLTGLHPLIQIMYLRGAYTNFLRFRWGEGGGWLCNHAPVAHSNLALGGGGGGDWFIRPCAAKRGKNVWRSGGADCLGCGITSPPPPPPRGVWGHALTEMDVLRHSGAF